MNQRYRNGNSPEFEDPLDNVAYLATPVGRLRALALLKAQIAARVRINWYAQDVARARDPRRALARNRGKKV